MLAGLEWDGMGGVGGEGARSEGELMGGSGGGEFRSHISCKISRRIFLQFSRKPKGQAKRIKNGSIF